MGCLQSQHAALMRWHSALNAARSRSHVSPRAGMYAVSLVDGSVGFGVTVDLDDRDAHESFSLPFSSYRSHGHRSAALMLE